MTQQPGPYLPAAPPRRSSRRLPWILGGAGLLAALLCAGLAVVAVNLLLAATEETGTQAGPAAAGSEAPPAEDVGQDVMSWLELPAMPPATEQTSKAAATGPATQVAFINDLAEPVTVSWLNENGQRVYYQTLAPGDMYTQPTYVGHPWVVSTLDGAAVAVFQPIAQPARAVVGG